MQLDIYNKITIETETIVYDVREWPTVYTQIHFKRQIMQQQEMFNLKTSQQQYIQRIAKQECAIKSCDSRSSYPR